MKTLHRSVVVLFLALVSLDPRSTFCQGPLTPPGSPVPTMKTLDQLEARTIVNAANTPGDATNTFIISVAGSYYLTGNLTGAAGKHGISVQADDVTLDLNGFALISGGGSTRGVDIPVAKKNLSVRNGTVRGWTDGGVRTDLGISTLAEKLRLTDNVGATGLALGNGSARDCVATGNNFGFVLGNGAEIRDCAASGNGTGFSSGDRAMISNCISTVNSVNGFSCTSFVTMVDCTSSRNSSDGIVVQGSSSVIRCNSTRNIPNGNGIVAGAGCSILDCTAGSNGMSGISADFGSTVRGCTTQANGSFGISLGGNCLAIGNKCDQNSQSGSSGAGLIAGGGGNRVEGNSCTNNGSGDGFFIASTKNLVIGNSARGNANNYHFFIDNRYGTIVDLTGTNLVTPGGNSASSSLTTFDPWANFAY